MDSSTNKDNQTIRTRLKAVRASLEKNQVEMAAVLGIRNTTYSGIERGASGLSAKQLAKLTEAYGVNVNWMLTGRGEMFLPEKLCA